MRRPCLGCGVVIASGSRCSRCAATLDRRRPSAAERGYTSSDWRTTRAAQLELEPECRACGAPATDVDHVLPRRRGGDDDPSNLQSLCHACHSRKTRREAIAVG